MPLVTVYAQNKWYPARWRRILHLLTAEQRAVLRAGREFPYHLARTVTHLDPDNGVNEGQVLLRFARLHADSPNTRDLWFRIEVGMGLVPRRKRLSETVERKVTDIFAASRGKGRMPTLDTDLIFVVSCGFSTGRHGEHLADW